LHTPPFATIRYLFTGALPPSIHFHAPRSRPAGAFFKEKIMLIGLAGFKRSGKDTAGKALVRLGFARVAFGDALREEVFAMHPKAKAIKDEDKERPQDFLGGKSLRDVLIAVGQGRRAEDPGYWVRLARDRIAAHLQEGRSVVVTDVRMHNEIDALRELGAVLAWISRPGVSSNGHETEQDTSFLCDHEIVNGSTPYALEGKIVALTQEQCCGRCAQFKPDATFSRYGFCKKATGTPEQKARLLDLYMRCQQPGEPFSATN
jgi:hypothetical protein